MSDAHHDEIAKLEALYQEHPEGRIFTHLAEAYRKAGQLERAQTILAEGLDRFPDYSSAHVVLGRVLMDQDRTDGAESEFRRVLELDPHNLIATRALGDLARARGDDREALDHYRRLLDQEDDESIRELVQQMEGGFEDDLPAGFDEPAPTGFEETARGVFEGTTPAGVETDDPTGFGDADVEAPEFSDSVPSDFDDEPAPWAGGVDAGAFDPEPPSGRSEPAAADRDGETELRTETIAQVYARQGLYDRAADVYRELARSRPDDPGLRDRLAEMEQLAAAQSGETGEVDAMSDFPGQGGGEPDFTDDELDGLPGLERTLETEAELEPSDAEPVAMEGFQPTELDTSDAEAAALPGLEPEESDPETGLVAESSPDLATGDDLSEEWDVRDVPEPPEESPFSEEATSLGESGGVGDEEAESVWTGSDWGPDDDGDTPHAWAEEPEPEPDASPPVREYLGGLLSWAGATGTERAAPGEPSSESRVDAAPGGSAADPSVGEDDDDLEMFRSWLESLKQ